MVYESVIEVTIISLLQNKWYELIDDNVIQYVINIMKWLENSSLLERNFAFHKILTDGITIESEEFQVNPHLQMKMLDKGFWKILFSADIKKVFKKSH